MSNSRRRLSRQRHTRVLAADVSALCPHCEARGEEKKVSFGEERRSIIHEPVNGKKIGPNGETGCPEFDALDTEASFVAFAKAVRVAEEQRSRN